HHRGRGYEPDQLLPAGERQEHEHPDDEAEDDAHHRDPPRAQLPEDLRNVSVAGEGEREPGAGAGVDESGTSGGDDRVYVEQDGEPSCAHGGCYAGEGTGEPLEGELGPPVGELVRCESTDERHLQQDVEDDPDYHRTDYGYRDVALRVAPLTAELDG